MTCPQRMPDIWKVQICRPRGKTMRRSTVQSRGQTSRWNKLLFWSPYWQSRISNKGCFWSFWNFRGLKFNLICQAVLTSKAKVFLSVSQRWMEVDSGLSLHQFRRCFGVPRLDDALPLGASSAGTCRDRAAGKLRSEIKEGSASQMSQRRLNHVLIKHQGRKWSQTGQRDAALLSLKRNGWASELFEGQHGMPANTIFLQ